MYMYMYKMYVHEGKVKTWLRILYYQICIEKCFKLAVDIQMMMSKYYDKKQSVFTFS